MARAKLILVGGFLGSGKTTLLARAAERLAARGLRVGLVTNDQAANLVDTEILRSAGQEVREVSGACFCCAFNKLLYVCRNLVQVHQPDVIVGEPVGSCTDLSATVLQPLKRYCADEFDLAPYSVLVDPARLAGGPSGDEAEDMPRAVRYILRKQLEEADLIVLNKADTLSDQALADLRGGLARDFPLSAVVAMSALRGSGVDEWLERVLGGGAAGGHIADVDYDTYAAGEAELGWLNAAVTLSAAAPTDWQALAVDFLRRARAELAAASAQIAHLKLILTADGGRLQANLTGNTGEPLVQADGFVVPPSKAATMVVNARVRTDPESLKAVIERCLRQAADAAGSPGPVAPAAGGAAPAPGGVAGSVGPAPGGVGPAPGSVGPGGMGTAPGGAPGGVAVNVIQVNCIRPGRPVPVHRFTAVVPPPAAP